jgi:Ni/Co efflux regulator RcnB
MLTFALLLASAAPIPAYAQFGARGGRDAGQEGASQPVDEARAARYERRAEAQAERRQERSRAAPDAGRQSRWGNGNWRGGQQVQPQAPASPQPQASPGQWGGNRNRQGRNDGMTTNPPQVRGEPRHEGRRDGDRNAGRDRSNRQGGVQGQYPVRQNDQRHWDGDRDNGRHWDRNRDHDRAVNQGGWHRQDNGRWERRDGHHWNSGSHYRDWNRTWRNDGRYDWQRYRNQYRNHYRAPRYYNPYGYSYGYRRFGIGIYLDSLFFGSRYWLSDPWEYRLPPAPYGCRWVRYYDDVLLVDTRSGYIVDVVHDFFW